MGRMHEPIGRLERAAVFLVIAPAMLIGLSAVRFHPDESHWIGLSARFEAFFAGRFSDPIWQTQPDRYVNAPMTYFVVGAARRLGGWTPDTLNAPFDYGRSYSQNLADGRIPQPGLLEWSRRGVAAAAVIGLYLNVIMFARAAGRPAAYAWLALVLVNPYLRETLRRAMNEGVLLATLALVLWATYRLLVELDRTPPERRRWRLAGWTALAGGAVGLVAQTKLNGAVAGLGVLAVLIMAAVRHPLAARRRAGYLVLGGVILAGSAALVFLGTNPALWPYPPRELVRVVRARTETIRGQTLRAGDAALQTMSDRGRVVPKRVFHDFALLPRTWMGTGLVLVGVILTLRHLRGWLARRNDNHAIVAVAVIGAVVSAPAFLTPLDWPRYYFLPVYFLGFPTVMGAYWLLRLAERSLSARYSGR
jgi:hypothetical protein